MTSDRPYRAAMDSQSAIAELRSHADAQFDAYVIEVLIELLHEPAEAPEGQMTAIH